MIISKNKNQAENTRRVVFMAVDTLNTLLTDYNATGLPPVKTTADLKKFGEAPFKFWEKQVEKRMEEKNMADADLGVFAALFNLEFKTKVSRTQSPPVAMLEYIRIQNGQAAVVEDLEKRLVGMGTVETTSPEEEAAAKELMRTYRDFAYWSTVLSGGSLEHIVTRGTISLGFAPMAIGQLSLDTVRRAVKASQSLDRKKFTERLVQQTGNQAWAEVE